MAVCAHIPGAALLAALLAAALLLAPGGIAAQGWIEPDLGLPRVPDVVKVRSDVEVRIRRGVAHVEVSEWFENRGGAVAQGDYHYPLPADAAFRSYSLFQGEEELRGEIMDAREARRIYEEIVRRRLDPALIELAGTGLLRARVFPIEAGDTRKITLRYAQLLPRAGEALHFRYAGGVRNAQPRPAEVGPRPPRRPGREIARPEPETSEASFFIEVEEGDHFLDPFSPTHDLEVERVRGRVRVRADGGLSGTFSLFLPLSREALGLGLVTHAPAGEEGYVMLTLSPGEADVRPQPRDLTVVLDVSGSMSGDKIRQAQDALHGLLETLEGEDRFRLVAFSSSVRPHALEWRRATPEAVADARGWVDRLEANGGTHIEAALGEAFRLEPSEERLPVVIFLTDGLPTVGEQSVERLAARAEERRGRSRVFAFGVGHDVNTHLLDRMTSAGRGTTTFVEPGESVERTLSLLTARIRHPVLTDVELVESPVRFHELYPVEIPDVFAGEALVLLGRYETAGREIRGDVVIRGRRAGREERFVLEARFPARSEEDAYLPRLWASRKLGFLTRRVWTEGASPELVEEIRATALRYGLPSEYTSYLVMEPGAALALDPAAGRRAAEARALTAAAPDAASGAGAVRAAREAGELRSVTSSADLEELEVRASRGFQDEGSGLRQLAGRFFRLVDGTWVDATRSPGSVLDVKAFSPAYFALLQALPELRPYVASLENVQVGGAELAVRIGDQGREHLDDAELADVVRRFRAGRGAGGSRGARGGGPPGGGPSPRFRMDIRRPETVTIDWGDLYRSTYQDLVRYLHRKVWDAERARDLAQEVFVRALGEEPDRPRAFLFTVAANLARDEARTAIRRKRHLTLLKGEADAAGPSSGADPERELQRKERREQVRRALDSLGAKDREVLVLWDAGMNYNEIADQTGLAPGAIGTTLARARRRLVEAHDELEKDHATPE